jgi:hypothetical protein
LPRFCFGAALVLIAASFSWAQEFSPSGKNEIVGTFGRTFISDQGVVNSGLNDSTLEYGAALSFEVNYARILHTTDWFDFALELPATFNPHEDLHYDANQIPKHYSSSFITPAARLRLIPGLAFSPWLSFGGGFGHFEASSELIYGGTNPGKRGSTTGVLQGGVGLDTHVPWRMMKRYIFRFEARDDWSGVPPINVSTGKTRQHNYYLGGGLAFGF